MFRTPSAFGALTSGFVALDSAASGHTRPTSRESCAAEVVAEAAAVPVLPADDSLAGARGGGGWTPPGSTHIRVVESLVLATICGYFAVGLVRVLAGL